VAGSVKEEGMSSEAFRVEQLVRQKKILEHTLQSNKKKMLNEL